MGPAAAQKIRQNFLRWGINSEPTLFPLALRHQRVQARCAPPPEPRALPRLQSAVALEPARSIGPSGAVGPSSLFGLEYALQSDTADRSKRGIYATVAEAGATNRAIGRMCGPPARVASRIRHAAARAPLATDLLERSLFHVVRNNLHRPPLRVRVADDSTRGWVRCARKHLELASARLLDDGDLALKLRPDLNVSAVDNMRKKSLG